jgi:hypothetical protein
MMPSTLIERRSDVAKAKDRGQDKNTKRVAQKSIKEKRAAKKAKKAATRTSE